MVKKMEMVIFISFLVGIVAMVVGAAKAQEWQAQQWAEGRARFDVLSYRGPEELSKGFILGRYTIHDKKYAKDVYHVFCFDRDVWLWDVKSQDWTWKKPWRVDLMLEDPQEEGVRVNPLGAIIVTSEERKWDFSVPSFL